MHTHDAGCVCKSSLGHVCGHPHELADHGEDRRTADNSTHLVRWQLLREKASRGAFQSGTWALCVVAAAFALAGLRVLLRLKVDVALVSVLAE